MEEKLLNYNFMAHENVEMCDFCIHFADEFYLIKQSNM